MEPHRLEHWLKAIGGKLDDALNSIRHQSQKVEKIMATLADVQADVAAIKTAVAQAIADLGDVETRLAAAIAAGADPTVLASIDADLKQATADLATAHAAVPPASGVPGATGPAGP